MRRLKSKYFLALSCFSIPKSKKERIRAAVILCVLEKTKKRKPLFTSEEVGISWNREKYPDVGLGSREVVIQSTMSETDSSNNEFISLENRGIID